MMKFAEDRTSCEKFFESRESFDVEIVAVSRWNCETNAGVIKVEIFHAFFFIFCQKLVAERR